jgi:hypothetical protein
MSFRSQIEGCDSGTTRDCDPSFPCELRGNLYGRGNLWCWKINLDLTRAVGEVPNKWFELWAHATPSHST